MIDEKAKDPELVFVSNSDLIPVTGTGVEWRIAVNEKTAGCTEFEFGEGTLDPGYSCSITPGNQFIEKEYEAVATIVEGTATVYVDGSSSMLTNQDCLFVPPGGEYTFSNESSEPLHFIWGIATDKKDQILGDGEIFDYSHHPEVVHTYRDLSPSVTLEEGSSLRHWASVFPQSVGSKNLNLGFFNRPPGSSIPLHGHSPPTITEVFTVLRGKLLIEDQAGCQSVLTPGDYLYVPEHGMHNNKNVGSENVLYACLETPARSETVSPVD